MPIGSWGKIEIAVFFFCLFLVFWLMRFWFSLRFIVLRLIVLVLICFECCCMIGVAFLRFCGVGFERIRIVFLNGILGLRFLLCFRFGLCISSFVQIWDILSLWLVGFCGYLRRSWDLVVWCRVMTFVAMAWSLLELDFIVNFPLCKWPCLLIGLLLFLLYSLHSLLHF